jgi:hypothetical protein
MFVTFCPEVTYWSKYLFFSSLRWDETDNAWHVGHHLAYDVRNDNEGVVIGRIIVRWKWSTLRKLTLVSLCSPQIPHDLTRASTQAATVGNQRVTTRATERPSIYLIMLFGPIRAMGVHVRTCQLTCSLDTMIWGLCFPILSTATFFNFSTYLQSCCKAMYKDMQKSGHQYSPILNRIRVLLWFRDWGLQTEP